MTTKDICWLAGLLEGEGCFSLQQRTDGGHGPSSITIKVKMTDQDIIERAATLLGTKVHERETWDRGKQTKTTYTTVLGGTWAASWMMTLYPLMGTRRREKIRECLVAWKLDKPSPNRSLRLRALTVKNKLATR
jgi:hypothetical protein